MNREMSDKLSGEFCRVKRMMSCELFEGLCCAELKKEMLLCMDQNQIKKWLSKPEYRNERIDILIYFGIDRIYENEDDRKEDVKKIFDAIGDDQKRDLLNDLFDKKNGFDTSKFEKVMNVLKEVVDDNQKIETILEGIFKPYGTFDMKVVISIFVSINDANQCKKLFNKMQKILEKHLKMIRSNNITNDITNDTLNKMNELDIVYEIVDRICIFCKVDHINDMIPNMNEDEIITVLNKIKMIRIEDLDVLMD